MSASARPDDLAFLRSSGLVSAVMQETDWAASPLGDASEWPPSLKLIVNLMLESQFPMFVAWGPTLGLLYNDAYAEILGDKHPAAIGRPMQEVWEEIWPEINGLVAETLSGRPVYRQDLPLLVHRSGGPEEAWFTFSYSPARDDAGLINGLFCAVAETTQAVIAEQSLRESERRLRLAIEGAQIGTWDWDLSKLRGSWSPRTMEILGTTSGDDVTLEQRSLTIHPDDRERVWREYREAWKARSDLVSEYRAVRPNGEVRWISSRGAFELDDQGNPVRTVGIVIDITDNKLVEERLRQLNESLEEQVAARSAERELLWNLSQDMLARADYNGMMSAVSPAWGRVLGWNEAELLSRGYAAFMHPEDAPETLAAIMQMGETRLPTRFRNRILANDGSYKPIEWTVTPEPGGLNFIAVGRDLTESKAREQELEIAQEALRHAQKMEAMGQLTGGVAHDFNNLLTPIIGSLDRLQRKGLGDDRDRRLIDGAMQSAERARTLVQRLLAFARRQPLQTTAVDTGALIDGLSDLLESTLGPRITLSQDIAASLPPAAADENQIEMAILNLAVNARDAMPDGGTLTISAQLVSTDASPRLDLPQGNYVRLSVEDTGSGMDKETLARAVEPFFSTKGIGQGTGLGLSMVHGLAAQMGGALEITSEVGQGTRVDFYLPTSDQPAVVAAAPAVPQAARKTGTILLVDDELLIRMSTAEMLNDLGYDVIEASSAEDALCMVGAGEHFDVLVTDHLMPGLSGVELAKELRKASPELPVLIVSGYADIEGVDANIPRLVKPFRLEELSAKLEDLVLR